MKMVEGGIDPHAPLDYIELQIFPTRNRYEAYVCSSKRAEIAATGALKQLLLHSPRVKHLSSKGSNTNFKILPPDNVKDAEWFTIATLTRFLHILGLPNILNIGNEISQLEETKKFQLALSLKAVVDITSSVDSKNELLRAVDLRLAALKDEVTAAFDQVTSGACTTKDISDLESFAHHFGAKDIRDLLQKFVEMSLFPTLDDSKVSVRDGVSTKFVQIEQHNSKDNENSSFSSEDDQPSVDRYRAAKRSATPRRSASPMRRIQIGRSGSHRAPALTIKSLNHLPTRGKISFQRARAGSSSDEDDDNKDKPAKQNVLRMSVQDKISLFERKQRDQKVDVPRTKKLLNTTGGPNKTVLRRWSSGMGENAMHDKNHKNSPLSPKSIEPGLESKTDPVPQPKSNDFIFESQVSNVMAESTKPQSPEREERCEKHPESIEWTQQNEEKLNELFMKMMEDKNKPRRHQNPNTVLKEERGGSYDQCKQKKVEKIRVEASGKKADKKAEIVQKEKSRKNSTPLMNSIKEPLKPSVLKKTASKPSSLPATRKSWSSTPSPRTPTGPALAGTTPTSRKPVGSNTKSEKSLPRSMAIKLTPKSTSPAANINLKSTKKTELTVTKSTKTTETKAQTPVVKQSFYNKVTRKSSVAPLETKSFLRKGSGIGSGASPVVIQSKVVEQPEDTFTTSGTSNHSEVDERVMANDICENEEKYEPEVVSLSPGSSPSNSLTKGEEPMSSGLEMPEVINEYKEAEDELVNDHEEEIVPCLVQTESPVKVVEPMSSSLELPEVINEYKEAEEELVNDHEEEIVPCLVQTESPVKVVVPACSSSSQQVRRSLSQMLLEESSEEADVKAWGNAEHPPSLVYQKDSPKGFKRLLKFARKTKAGRR